MNDDAELLQQYAQHGSEDAFATLVKRHLDLVWGAARRVTQNDDQARDAAQAVFVALARKAGGLRREVILAGWLHRAACLEAAKLVRGNVRRQQRELKAMEEQSLLAETPGDEREARAILPQLDEALGCLTGADRDAVVLRFFARKSLAEVGTALGASPDAAQKRLSRALDKLREFFRRRGITVSTGAVTLALGAAGAQAAPVGLVVTMATASLAAAGAPGLAAGILNYINLMKAKLIWSAVTLAVVGTPFVAQQKSLTALRKENSALKQQAQQMPAVETGRGAGNGTGSGIGAIGAVDNSEHAELLRLRGEVAQLRALGTEARRRATSNQPSAGLQADGEGEQPEGSDVAKINSIAVIKTMAQIALAARRFAGDHEGNVPRGFEEMQSYLKDALTPEQLAKLDQFELARHDHPITETDVDKIWLRERVPRREPNGKWVRTYSLADGSTQNRHSDTGDFSAWEKGRMAQAADNQVAK